MARAIDRLVAKVLLVGAALAGMAFVANMTDDCAVRLSSPTCVTVEAAGGAR